MEVLQIFQNFLRNIKGHREAVGPFNSVLCSLGQNLINNAVNELIQTADEDNDLLLTFSDFLFVMQEFCVVYQEEVGDLSVSLSLSLVEKSLETLETLFPLDRDEWNWDIRQNACGLLHTLLPKLDGEQLQPFATRIFDWTLNFLTVATDDFELKGFDTLIAILEECFPILGWLANSLPVEMVSVYHNRIVAMITKYVQSDMGENENLYFRVKTGAIALIGDLSRALGKQILSSTPVLVEMILSKLQNKFTNPAMIPSLLYASSDLALAIEGYFVKYLPTLLRILENQVNEEVIASINDSERGEQEIDYWNELCEALLTVYCSLMQSLRSIDEGAVLLPTLDSIKPLLKKLSESDEKSDAVLRRAVELIGDLGQTFNSPLKVMFLQSYITNLINEAKDAGEEVVPATTIEWVLSMIAKVKTSL